jgi:hypothetical protein
MRTKGNLKYGCNSSYFDAIDTEEKAYILGLFYTDGNVASKGNRVCLGMNDKDVVEFVKKSLEATHPIHVINDIRTRNLHYRLNICNEALHTSLIKLGCIPSKSQTIEFPHPNIVPRHLLRSFVLGCFDGDGAIFSSDNRNFTWHFIGTKSMCDGIASHIKENLDVDVNVKPVRKSAFLYQMRCWKRDSIFKILSHLYHTSAFKMDRKFITFAKIKALVEFRPTDQYWVNRKRNERGEFIYG